MSSGDILPVFLTTADLAKMLRMSPRSFEKMRLENRGPRYHRLGQNGRAKVVYRLSHVLEWLEGHRKT